MVTKKRVQAVLDPVRPLLTPGGGDVEALLVVGNSAAARLNAGVNGPSAHMTLHVGIENELREEIPEVDTPGGTEARR